MKKKLNTNKFSHFFFFDLRNGGGSFLAHNFVAFQKREVTGWIDYGDLFSQIMMNVQGDETVVVPFFLARIEFLDAFRAQV